MVVGSVATNRRKERQQHKRQHSLDYQRDKGSSSKSTDKDKRVPLNPESKLKKSMHDDSAGVKVKAKTRESDSVQR